MAEHRAEAAEAEAKTLREQLAAATRPCPWRAAAPRSLAHFIPAAGGATSGKVLWCALGSIFWTAVLCTTVRAIRSYIAFLRDS